LVFKEFFGFIKKPYKDIIEDDVENYYQHLRKRSLAMATIATRIMSLRGFFRYLKDKKLIRNNPVKIKFKNNDRKTKILKQILSREEIDKLLKVAKNPRDNCILALMYGHGMRISEVTNLKVEDIRFNEKKIIIQGKGGKERINDIKPCIFRRLELWLKLREDLVSRFKNKIDSVFVSKYGKRISVGGIRGVFKKYKKLAKIKKKRITPHSLRHTFITHAIEDGVPVPEVQNFVGHERIETTMIYFHIAQMNKSYLSKFRDF